jgi:predicted nuclease with TOPRIM domain
MKEQLQNRLVALKAEFETGQQRLAEVENQAATLRQTLLRISGAIQVLEEELSKSEGGEPETEGS